MRQKGPVLWERRGGATNEKSPIDGSEIGKGDYLSEGVTRDRFGMSKN